MSMQKRYVEISSDDNILRYYKHRADPQPVGALNLTLLDKVYCVEGPLFRFRLKSVLLDRKSLLLEASNALERDEWIAAIKGCMSKYDETSNNGGNDNHTENNHANMDDPDVESRPEGDENNAKGGKERVKSVTSITSNIFGRKSLLSNTTSLLNDPGTESKESIMHGFLEKRSGNKLVSTFLNGKEGMSPLTLMAFFDTIAVKNDIVDCYKALHSIDLRKVEFVRAYESSADCTKFEIGDGVAGIRADEESKPPGIATVDSVRNDNRVYLFDAGSAEGRHRWVQK